MRTLQRHFWIVTAAAVVLCAFFAAKAAANLVESSFLPDAPVAARAPVRVALAERRGAAHSKDGTQLGQRNMFCADCTPALDAQDPAQPVASALRLLATNVSVDPSRSFASIANGETHVQGGYRVGDQVPGAGQVKEIHYRYVTFDHQGRLERLALLDGGVEPTTPAMPATAPIEGQDEVGAALDAGIKKVDVGSYEVDRALVDKILANPTAFIKGLRAVPAMVDGKINGFKLYAISQQSAAGRLGLASGDTLQAINGFELTSLDKVFEVYAKLRDASSLELSLSRRGKPASIKVSIR